MLGHNRRMLGIVHLASDRGALIVHVLSDEKCGFNDERKFVAT